MRLTIRKKGLIIIAVPLLFNFLFVGLLLVEIDRSEKQTQMDVRARDLRDTLNRLLLHSYEAAASIYAYALKHDPRSADIFDAKVENINSDLQGLHALKDAGTTLNKADLEALAEKIENGVSLLKRRKESINYGSRNPSHIERMQALKLTGSITTSAKMLGDLIDKATVPGTVDTGRDKLRLLICFGLLANALMTMGIGIFFAKNIEQGIQRILLNLDFFGRKEPLLPLLQSNDELGHVDKSFHDMAAALEKAETVKHNFISMISHDIRTPVTSLKNIFELLEQGYLEDLDEDARQFIHDGASESKRLVTLVNNLLDLSLIELGKFQIDPKPIDLSIAVNQAISSLRLLAQQKQITVSSDLTKAPVYADFDRIVEVLINLISNAIKYSDRNTSITVSATTSDGYTEVIVSDQAQAISEADRQRIFESFQRLTPEDASQSTAEGVGLGLAICKSIMESHGGAIGVTNNEAGGNNFWFRIPARSELFKQSEEPAENISVQQLEPHTSDS